VSSYPLSLIAVWLGFVPFTLLMLGLSALAALSARAAGRSTLDLSPVPLYCLTMALVAVAGLVFAALAAMIRLLLRFAPHASSGSRTQVLEVEHNTSYVTAGQAAAFHALQIALAVAFGAAFVVGALWRHRNKGACQRPQQ
jgi:hypothetical protein